MATAEVQAATTALPVEPETNTAHQEQQQQPDQEPQNELKDAVEKSLAISDPPVVAAAESDEPSIEKNEAESKTEKQVEDEAVVAAEVAEADSEDVPAQQSHAPEVAAAAAASEEVPAQQTDAAEVAAEVEEESK